ncbi:glycine-rich protein [Musa troglodytarum]|uniref:Glycine-rich protein n=1 Tax=Musa troglodytarum TaxID=320322 RepID=A0A9E7H1W5_9LILI|nr:glycine-rich protein [Musa troglodytarum]
MRFSGGGGGGGGRRRRRNPWQGFLCIASAAVSTIMICFASGLPSPRNELQPTLLSKRDVKVPPGDVYERRQWLMDGSGGGSGKGGGGGGGGGDNGGGGGGGGGGKVGRGGGGGGGGGNGGGGGEGGAGGGGGESSGGGGGGGGGAGRRSRRRHESRDDRADGGHNYSSSLYRVGEYARCSGRGRCGGMKLLCPMHCDGPCFYDCHTHAAAASHRCVQRSAQVSTASPAYFPMGSSSDPSHRITSLSRVTRLMIPERQDTTSLFIFSFLSSLSLNNNRDWRWQQIAIDMDSDSKKQQ